MKNNSCNTHEFAFYLENISSLLSSLPIGSELCIHNAQTCYRIKNVIRLNQNDTCIIFDQFFHFRISFQSIEKQKYLHAILIQKNKNRKLAPSINFLLPILKKENFENALYSLVELGVQKIQPLITQKTKLSWKNQKTIERFNKILIAAAEQSKNFIFPELKIPLKLEEYLRNEKKEDQKVYFDINGKKLHTVLQDIKKQSQNNVTLMIGPEGDLTDQEKNFLFSNGFIFCKLTPTVLRSFQAVAISVGIFRSML